MRILAPFIVVALIIDFFTGIIGVWSLIFGIVGRFVA